MSPKSVMTEFKFSKAGTAKPALLAIPWYVFLCVMEIAKHTMDSWMKTKFYRLCWIYWFHQYQPHFLILIIESSIQSFPVPLRMNHRFSILSNWTSMPYQQDGDCPFEGLHWPKTWPLETKVTAKKFCLLDELQRRDLIQYFYKRESAKTKQRPQPSYEFPLIRFCDYFGRFHGNIRKAVLSW